MITTIVEFSPSMMGLLHDRSKFNSTEPPMSERVLDRLHVSTPDGVVGGHDRSSSSFSVASPMAGHRYERTGSACLSPMSSTSGPPSPTRYAPVNCEVHMLVPTSPAEEPLAEHIRVLLKETDSDPTAFQHLRDIYLQTIQPSTTASPLLKQLHCMPATSSAIANAVQASEESSVILGSSSTTASLLKSPMALKMKSNYHQWKSTFSKAKDGEHDDDNAEEDGLAPTQPPITDLVVVFSGDVTPEDFEKIEKSPGGIKADLNRGRRGQFVYLCQKRETPSAFGYKRPPISDIILIYPERGECPPPNYELVQRRGVAANLNSGVSGEKLFMCFKRSASSSITDIAVVFPKKGEKVPYGYMKIDKTPNGHSVDVHTNMEVSICYKKHIGLVEYLKPLWWHATLAKPPQPPAPLTSQGSKSKGRAAFFEDGDSKADSTKSGEIRDETPPHDDRGTTNPSLSRSASAVDPSSDDDLSTLIKYMYPLLVSCHMRQGTIAVQAIARLETLLDSDLVKRHVMKNDAYLLTALVETINTSCQQGLRDRVPIVMGVLSKVNKQYAHEFSSVILHEVTKALLFANDFDDGAARAALEDVIHSVMRRVDVDKDAIQANLTKLFAANSPVGPGDAPLANIVYGVASEAVTTVEIARMNENALNIIKGHSSIYSAGFCHEIQQCIKGLLQTTSESNAYQLIATLSKYATKRNCSTVDQAYEKDCASIKNTLHMLDVALLSGPPVFKDHPIFGQQIRRFVCSVVNSACVMWSESVLCGTLSLVTTLWNQYRRHLKVELALLFENVFLRILRSPGPTAATFQSLVLHELMPWFQLPHNVVEIFLNFDMDRQFVQQWKVFEQFCAALCSITETSCVNGGPSDADDANVLDIGEQSLSTILAILRSLMDASGHAHLILRNDKTRILSMEKGGWELDEFSTPTSPTAAQPELSPHAASSPDDVQPQDDHESNPILNQKLGSIYGTVRERNELQKKSQQLLKRGMEIAETKSFKKALEYLVAMGLIKESPRDITSFLRIYHTFFDESDIGDYLGEGDEEFKLHIRLTYARAISFTGMTLVEALRHYLTHGGFKLPGEAQKIARMVEAFAQCYFEDLAGATSFSSSDTIMILAYSIIMLNTDLHNPQVKKNKMSKDQFVKNNRGIDNGNDVPKALLEDIYDDILANPIQLKGLAYTLPSNKADHASNADAECEKFRMWLSKSVTQSEDLMKDLARSKFTFNFFGVDASISPDLVKILFERVWFHFLALSTTILSNNQSDLSLVLQCLDMLRYCISICVFLEMHVERQAFSNQLTKLQTSDTFGKEPSKEPAATDDQRSHQPEWLEGHKSSDTDPWSVIGDIHVYVNKLKDSIQKRQTVENLKSVTKRINRSHVYLHDSTQFIREGDLTKKCRTGRHRLYRFFLFNDQLLYADKGISGNFNAHQSLRLRLTRLADIPDSLLVRNAFQILNPVKTFTVVAETAVLKAEWMREIEEAIMEANKKTNINLRRLSTARGLKRENNAAIIAEAKANAKDKADETSGPTPTTPPVMWMAHLDV